MFEIFQTQQFKIFIAGLLFISYAGLGQSQNITGKVTSPADQSPLPGINVLVKNGTVGTTTNAEGIYEIQAGEDAVLVFSAIG